MRHMNLPESEDGRRCACVQKLGEEFSVTGHWYRFARAAAHTATICSRTFNHFSVNLWWPMQPLMGCRALTHFLNSLTLRFNGEYS